MTRAVVNSTPLIALSLTGNLSLLQALFKEVVVPTAVYEEVVLRGQKRPGAEEVAKAVWILVRNPSERFSLPPALLGLGRGEMDVILLARELEADWVLTDDKLARRVAMALGLRVKGTLGVLLAAFQAGLISRDAAETAVDTLARTLWISPRLVDWFRAQLMSPTLSTPIR